MKNEYIICSAIHWQTGKVHPHQPKNIESGIVVCGRRHHNAMATMHILKPYLYKNWFLRLFQKRYRIVQGFVSDRDNFYNRTEAMQIALKSGQTEKDYELLFSEDLY